MKNRDRINSQGPGVTEINVCSHSIYVGSVSRDDYESRLELVGGRACLTFEDGIWPGSKHEFRVMITGG